jgi:SAM-dependent methyltransferase
VNDVVAAYDPSIFFNVETVAGARKVILTPDGMLTSDDRWQAETAFILDVLARHITRGSLVLDFGCGIGRLAKPLVGEMNCRVIGIDISPNMRALAASCVESDAFAAMSPAMLDAIVADGSCHGAIAIWALQHVLDLELEIGRIKRVLKCDACLFIMNNRERAVPTNATWIDDGKNVDEAILASGFECTERGKLDDPEVAKEWLTENTFWAIYRKV